MAQKIQTLLFSKEASPADVNGGNGWTKDAVCEYAEENGFRADVAEAEDVFSCEQFDASETDPESYEQHSDGLPEGVKAVACKAPALPDPDERLHFEMEQRGLPTAPQHKAAILGIEDEEQRIVNFIASDETPDRMGDIIRAAGWNLKNWRKNPVLLWGHQSSDPPIGTVVDTRVEGTRLLSRAKFMPAGMYPFADMIWNMTRAGFLRAVSVGFLPAPDGFVPRKGSNGEFLGYEFVKQELLELSVVPVPANPSALTVARSMGVDSRTMAKLFVPTPEQSARVSVAHRHLENRLRLARLGGTGAKSILKR